MHSRGRTAWHLAPAASVCQSRIRLIRLPSRDATLIYNGVPVPVTTGVRFRAINDQGVRTDKTTFHDVLFDTGLRGEMGEFGDYFKSWNWELGFRYSRNDGAILFRRRGEQRQACAKRCWIRIRLQRLILFWGSLVGTAKPPSAEFMLLCTKAANLSCLWVISLSTAICSIFPAGPVSFAVGLEYRGERWKNDPASENTTFDTIGCHRFRSFTGEPGRLGNLSGSAISGDQPAVELPRRVQPRVRYCRARGMVQPKYLCGSAHREPAICPGATLAI